MKKALAIVVMASVVFVAGISVAYYNISSTGYDNSGIIYIDDEQISLLDYRIEYNEIKERLDKIKKVLPDTYITI